MLSMVSDYSFNWHNNYVYADDAAPLLPKGTILKITSWHDNTTANKNNPDPNQWVGWGDRTVDEMAHAWVNITYMDDEDFKVEVEKRKAKLDDDHDRSSSSSSQAGSRRGRRTIECGDALFDGGSTARALSLWSTQRSRHGASSRCRRCAAGVASSRVASLLGVVAPGAAAAAAAGARRGSERHGRLRGLVPEPRRPLHAARRLLQSQRQSRRSTSRSARTIASSRAGPTTGQPTHFVPRRQWGVFTIKVPKDFGDKRLTWTIVANGQTTSLPIGVIKDYQVEPFKEVAQGNEPPKHPVRSQGSRVFQGPPVGIAATPDRHASGSR